MPRFNYRKLQHHRRPGSGGSGYGPPTPIPEEIPPRPRRIKWCARKTCRQPFDYLPTRAPTIELCDDCRADVEAEALLNHLDADLPDDKLLAALTGIASAERQVIEFSVAARRARAAGNTVAAIRHRDRMVAASVRKRSILEAAA